MKKKSHIKNYRVTLLNPKHTQIISQQKVKRVDEIRITEKTLLLYHPGDEQPFLTLPQASAVLEEIV